MVTYQQICDAHKAVIDNGAENPSITMNQQTARELEKNITSIIHSPKSPLAFITTPYGTLPIDIDPNTPKDTIIIW